MSTRLEDSGSTAMSSDSDSDSAATEELSISTAELTQSKHMNLSRESSFSSPQCKEEKSFRPLNFPTSPEFTPPPRVRTPLPGIVPERPAPYETEQLKQQQQQQQGLDEEEHIVEREESKLTWLHFLVVCLAVSLSVVGALYTTSSLPGMQKKEEPSLVSSTTFSIEESVNSKLFGQPQAVSKVLETLRAMTQSTRGDSWCRVILFAGGPGVGKDYLAQIIKDHFYKVGGPQCKEHSYLSLNTKKLNCIRSDYNILSLETLYSMDNTQIKKATVSLKSLMKDCEKNRHKMAFILPVLTVKAHSIASLDVRGVDSFSSSSEYWQNVKSEAAKVKQKLQNSNVECELIRFKPLSWSHVKMCITESASRQGRASLSQETMDDVLNVLLSTTRTAQDFVPVGCKDVDATVAVLPAE